ncbi:GNAT family N-acetyltransferase [Paenibacillus sp. 7124]|uniref:GNAT family N-acetyltransferase n=1 Tax=Paenibacillus apii TaxID=1850370 RepID=A0A6M1PLR6_9BACL|nr:GNAT family N-acetyltransferase [Paenibacillus apii]NGM83398.1 GNAT family N-acetyltransferase [Paenibacillus apii]
MLIKDMDTRAKKKVTNLSGPLMVSRGKVHRLEELPGCCAEDEDGNLLSAIFYHVRNGECEIVSLESRTMNIGAGTRLIEAVIARARAEGWARVWLITSNDNTKAVRFYQKRGFDLKAVHRDAITEARKLKPSIPLIGNDGIPIRHELELEYLL